MKASLPVPSGPNRNVPSAASTASVGMSRHQLRRMVRLEAVIVAVLGELLGVAVGLFFGFAVSTALPDNFVESISVPIGTLVFLVVLAAIVGVLAAITPARRASRLDILDESHRHAAA